MEYDVEIDTRGEHCPMPVLRTYQTMRTMSDHQVIKVIAGRCSVENFAAFAKAAGRSVVRTEERRDGGFDIMIEKTPLVPTTTQ